MLMKFLLNALVKTAHVQLLTYVDEEGDLCIAVEGPPRGGAYGGAIVIAWLFNEGSLATRSLTDAEQEELQGLGFVIENKHVRVIQRYGDQSHG